jgi:hypothetical protein
VKRSRSVCPASINVISSSALFNSCPNALINSLSPRAVRVVKLCGHGASRLDRIAFRAFEVRRGRRVGPHLAPHEALVLFALTSLTTLFLSLITLIATLLTALSALTTALTRTLGPAPLILPVATLLLSVSLPLIWILSLTLTLPALLLTALLILVAVILVLLTHLNLLGPCWPRPQIANYVPVTWL